MVKPKPPALPMGLLGAAAVSFTCLGSQSLDCTKGSNEAATIWVLTWGSRGDHEPAAALALGLRERGHKVKVFGCVEMRKMFAAYGLDFDALDMDAFTHPKETASKREKLAQLAADAGFAGPDKVADFLFDTRLQWLEYLNRRLTKLLEEGRPIEEALAETHADRTEMGVFAVTGLGIEKLSETRLKHATFLAQHHKEALANHLLIARKARAKFQSFLRQAASEYGCTPYELLNTFFACYRLYAEMRPKAEKGDVGKLVIEMVNDLFSWYDVLTKELQGSLDDYWERWMSRFPPLEGCLNSGQMEVCARATLNMQLWFEAAPVDERPTMVISHFNVFSAAAQLQAQHGVHILFWQTYITWLRSIHDLARMHDLMVANEGDWPAVPKPMRSMGPLHLLRMLQPARWIVSTTALMLSHAGGSAQKMRACCTGQWVVSGQQSGQHSANAFGSQEECEELETFLSADGGAPVYFGWGSMGSLSQPEGLARLIVRTLKKIDRRGVIVAGWSGLQRRTLDAVIDQEYEGSGGAQRAKRQIVLIASASHTLLFPRCACTVHHGGAGTTQAALRSGVPTIIATVGFDQPANADWAVSLGCSVKVSPLAELTHEELARALTAVLEGEGYKTKAKMVAAVMAEEHGVASAVEIVENCLRDPQPPWAAPAPKPTWADGLYTLEKASAFEFPSLVQVLGETMYPPEPGRAPIGQLWAGEFRVEEKEDGVKPGTYNVQAWLISSVTYLTVSADGRELVLHDGSRFKWKARSLLVDGLYHRVGTNGKKTSARPTIAVRGTTFYMGQTVVGGYGGGEFEVKEATDGRKVGKYYIQAAMMTVLRCGTISEDGKTLSLDDGSGLSWDAPLP